MPGNMKCGRLRSSNCFVVFFPLFEFSQLVFLRSPPTLFFLSSVVLRFILSPFRPCTQRRISTYTTALCFLFFLLLFDSYSVFPDFFISSFRSFLSIFLRLPLPFGYFFSLSFFYASIFMHRESIHVILSSFLRSLLRS